MNRTPFARSIQCVRYLNWVLLFKIKTSKFVFVWNLNGAWRVVGLFESGLLFQIFQTDRIVISVTRFSKINRIYLYELQKFMKQIFRWKKFKKEVWTINKWMQPLRLAVCLYIYFENEKQFRPFLSYKLYFRRTFMRIHTRGNTYVMHFCFILSFKLIFFPYWNSFLSLFSWEVTLIFPLQLTL